MIVALDVWCVFLKLLFGVYACERCLKLEFHDGDFDVSRDKSMAIQHCMCCHTASPWIGDIPCWKLYNTPHCKSFNRTKTETPKWNPANLLQGNLQNDFLVATVHKTSSWRVVQLKNMTIHWVPRPNLGRPVCVRNAILSTELPKKKRFGYISSSTSISANNCEKYTHSPIWLPCFGGVSCQMTPRSAGKFGQVIFTPLWVWCCRHIQHHVCDLLKTRPSKSTQWSGRSPKLPKQKSMQFLEPRKKNLSYFPLKLVV